MAKVSVVALRTNDKILNILTSIKVTSFDEKQEDFKLITEIQADNNQSIFVYEAYLCFEDLEKFQQNICANGYIEIKEQKILYYVDEIPRSSFLLQREDRYADKYNDVLSPFYSNCYLEEYWNKNPDIKTLWLNYSNEIHSQIKPYVDINLDYFIDKVGNVLKFIQVNEVDVVLLHQSEKFITLSFKINKNTFDENYVVNKYVANIEVKSASDIILKKSFEINKRFVDIEIQDSDDNIQLEIFNLNNNKCVYKRNMYFFGNGTTHSHQVKKDVTSSPYKYNIELINQHPGNEISSLENLRTKWTRKIKRKDESEFVRFNDTEKNKAFDYLIKTVSDLAKNKGLENKQPEYVYIADPYLYCNVSLNMYLKFINSLSFERDTEFRFIGGQNSIPECLVKEMKRIQNQYTNIIFKSIRIKEKDQKGNFLTFSLPNGKKEYKTKEPFHDRFIASKHAEYGFTNSINNFQKGVTFFRSFDVYFEDAEALWNISLNNNDYVIEVVS